MKEAELELGIMDALTIAGWRWTHIRDSRGITQGHSGIVDIIAVHPRRDVLLLWELKGDGGALSPDQWGWLGPLQRIASVIEDALQLVYDRGLDLLPDQAPAAPPTILDVRVVYPSEYDHALALIVGKVDRWPG